MNLGKLLAAGKGFLGGRKTVSYREDKRVYLPKFNAEKNPFEPKEADKKPETVVLPEKTAMATPVKASVVVPVAVSTVAKAAAPVAAAKQPVFAVQKPVAAVSWAERLNPFRATSTTTAAATPLVRPVQTELSLNAVKVLHNDLSDADVEVVPVKSRTATPTEAPRLLPGRQTMEFFSERQLETA